VKFRKQANVKTSAKENGRQAEISLTTTNIAQCVLENKTKHSPFHTIPFASWRRELVLDRHAQPYDLTNTPEIL
jgi:hypothetical protein